MSQNFNIYVGGEVREFCWGNHLWGVLWKCLTSCAREFLAPCEIRKGFFNERMVFAGGRTKAMGARLCAFLAEPPREIMLRGEVVEIEPWMDDLAQVAVLLAEADSLVIRG